MKIPLAARLLRALIVEDDPVNQLVMTRFLTHLDVEYDVVADGSEALLAIAGQPYDIVFLDLILPTLGGIDVARQLRTSEHAASWPYLVAVTARVMLSDRNACMAAGINDFLAKPIQIEQIAETLLRAASARQRAPL